ncbi:MAG: hypothetical protein OCD00_10185 [Colwellia sp.]
MKLSRTAWNNVIIFSVMIIILMINATNDKLFPDEKSQSSHTSDQWVLPEHSVILTVETSSPTGKQVFIKRDGRHWQVRPTNATTQQIEQLIFSWQQSSGLVQADDILIADNIATKVTISIAGVEQKQRFSLYPLIDQLLIFNHQKKIWLALPAAMSNQLLPQFISNP